MDNWYFGVKNLGVRLVRLSLIGILYNTHIGPTTLYPNGPLLLRPLRVF